MKREKVASVALTDEEYGELMKRMADSIHQTGNHVTVSSFIREYVIKPYLNGSPSEEAPEETKDSISKGFDDINF